MKRGAADCPKMKALGRAIAQLVGVDPMIGRHIATSLLHRLWEWATDYAPGGSLGSVELEDLAEALRWPGEIGPLIVAMQDERSRWLDVLPSGELYIHDWHDHCEKYVHRKLIRARARFANGDQPSLNGINDKERPAIQAWYDENPAQDRAPARVRTAGAQRAHGVQPAGTPASPRLASPRHASGGEQISGDVEPPIALEPPSRSAGSLAPRKAPDSDPPPKANGTANRMAEVIAIWPACVEAAAGYGRGWDELNPNRRREMNARLMERRDQPSEILVHAIHGAMRSWGPASETFDPKKNCRPETIYRASKFPKYLEAHREHERRLQKRGPAPPPKPEEPKASEEQRAAGLAALDKAVGKFTVPRSIRGGA